MLPQPSNGTGNSTFKSHQPAVSGSADVREGHIQFGSKLPLRVFMLLPKLFDSLTKSHWITGTKSVRAAQVDAKFDLPKLADPSVRILPASHRLRPRLTGLR